jgi:high-affinity iron transporter
MTGRISTPNLVLGLGYGFAVLAVVGVLLTIVGIKIPMRPFFAVASALTFYLCFKFLGTGIHALQVADVIDARTSESLPSNDTLGLFPTWQTTVPQLLLLLAGLTVAVWGRISDLAVGKRTQATAD